MSTRLKELNADLKEHVRALRALKRAYGCTKGWYVEHIRNPIRGITDLLGEEALNTYLEGKRDAEWVTLWGAYRAVEACEERPLYEGILETLEKKIHGHSLLYNATLREIKLELTKALD